MALRKGYSVTVGVTDLAYLFTAFEDMNECTLTVSFTPIQKNGKSDLLMQMSAFMLMVAGAEPVRLASLDLTLARDNFLSLEVAIVHGMYLIDQLLEDRRRELEGTI